MTLRPEVPGRVVLPLVLALTAALLTLAPADGARARRVHGADISWPQCPKGTGIKANPGQDQPMPLKSARYVIMGLTNGPGFTPNPCLKSQVRWVKRRELWAAAYAVTTYPTRRQLRRHGTTGPHRHAELVGRLWNTGYAQGNYNLRTLEAVRLATPTIWVDVEPSSARPWSHNKYRNGAVVKGIVKAYQDAGFLVGFYSTRRLWRAIVGDLRFGLPEWRTAGPTTEAAALRMCSKDRIQGGKAILAQWWSTHRDFGVTCPGHGTRAQMRKWFHHY